LDRTLCAIRHDAQKSTLLRLPTGALAMALTSPPTPWSSGTIIVIFERQEVGGRNIATNHMGQGASGKSESTG
jgi:hypothetical protein